MAKILDALSMEVIRMLSRPAICVGTVFVSLGLFTHAESRLHRKPPSRRSRLRDRSTPSLVGLISASEKLDWVTNMVSKVVSNPEL